MTDRLTKIDRRLKPANMLRRLCAAVESATPDVIRKAQRELYDYAKGFARYGAGGRLMCSAGDMDRAQGLLSDVAEAHAVPDDDSDAADESLGGTLYGPDGIDETPWTLSAPYDPWTPAAPYDFYYTDEELDADDDPVDPGPSSLVPVRSRIDVPGFPSAFVSMIADGDAFEVALVVGDAGEDFDFNFDIAASVPSVVVPEVGVRFDYGRPCFVRRFKTRDEAAAYQVTLVRMAEAYAFAARVMTAHAFVIYAPSAASAKAAAGEARVLRRAVDDADPCDPFEGRISAPVGTPRAAVPFVEEVVS